jgi:hypothetical protein
VIKGKFPKHHHDSDRVVNDLGIHAAQWFDDLRTDATTLSSSIGKYVSSQTGSFQRLSVSGSLTVSGSLRASGSLSASLSWSGSLSGSNGTSFSAATGSFPLLNAGTLNVEPPVWIPLAMSASRFANYGPPYETLAYAVMGGITYLKGLVHVIAATSSGGEILTVIPAGARPATTFLYGQIAYTTTAYIINRIDINPQGSMAISTALLSTSFFEVKMSWPAEV